jgi:hypothetical protein
MELAKARDSLELPHFWEGRVLRIKFRADGGDQFEVWSSRPGLVSNRSR